MVRAASRGDGDARSAFSRSYTSVVRRYLQHRWSFGSLRDSIDDALQDVFVECFKPDGVLSKADPRNGDFRALLYAVVRNVAHRHESRAAASAKHQPGSVLPEELPDQAESLSRMFDRTWAQSLLREAVLRHAAAARRGTPDFRSRYRILRLRHQRGLEVHEIATKLGESDVAAVHNAYRRARREFRAKLRDVVGQHRAADESVDDACYRVMDLLKR